MIFLHAETSHGEPMYGISAVTHYDPDETEPHGQIDDTELRPVVLVSLFAGCNSVHLALYASEDGERRVGYAYAVQYQPGYGWLNSWRERRTSLRETLDRILSRG